MAKTPISLGWTLLLATTMITSICKPIHVSHQQEKIISKLFKELEHHSQKHCAHTLTHTHTHKSSPRSQQRNMQSRTLRN